MQQEANVSSIMDVQTREVEMCFGRSRLSVFSSCECGVGMLTCVYVCLVSHSVIGQLVQVGSCVLCCLWAFVQQTGIDTESCVLHSVECVALC